MNSISAQRSGDTRTSLLWFVIPVVWASGMLLAQYHGEDEALTLLRVQQILRGLRDFDPMLIAMAIGGDWHPPGRNLLPLPFVALLGDSLWVLRLPNLLFWGADVLLAALIARHLAGAAAGWVTALLLGLSGLFQIEAMGFGHGLATFWGVALCYHLLRNPPQSLADRAVAGDFLIGGLLLAAGFLWFTTFAVLIASYHLYYFWLAWRDAGNRAVALKRTILLSIPFGLFYALYYAVFLGVPYYMLVTGKVSEPFGQLHQNFTRAGHFGLHVGSLIDNLRATNWYFFPVLSWLVVAITPPVLWARHRALFWLITPYLVLVCLVMFGNTGQHYVSWFVWALPFTVAFLFERAVHDGLRRAVAVTAVALVATWSAIIHLPIYSQLSYPYFLVGPTFSDVRWVNNEHRPVKQIAAVLKAASDRGLRLASLDDGSFQLQVLPQANWAKKPFAVKEGDCIRRVIDETDNRAVGAILYDRRRITLCVGQFDVTGFENSYMAIGVLKAAGG